MLFIWNRWGFVVPIIWFVTLWIVEIVTNTIFGSGIYQTYTLPKLIGVIPVSIIIWIAGNALNENIYSDHKHSFFFIPVEYWAVIVPVLTFVMKVIF